MQQWQEEQTKYSYSEVNSSRWKRWKLKKEERWIRSSWNSFFNSCRSRQCCVQLNPGFILRKMWLHLNWIIISIYRYFVLRCALRFLSNLNLVSWLLRKLWFIGRRLHTVCHSPFTHIRTDSSSLGNDGKFTIPGSGLFLSSRIKPSPRRKWNSNQWFLHDPALGHTFHRRATVTVWGSAQFHLLLRLFFFQFLLKRSRS